MFFMARQTDPTLRLSSGRQSTIAHGNDVTAQFSRKGACCVNIAWIMIRAMKSELAGKRALVVGGSGGIGRSLAEALIAEGATVTAVGRHPVPGAESCVVDLDNSAECAIVLSKAFCAEILAVVRGPFLQKPLGGTSREEWESITWANLGFPGALVSAALPAMEKARWGRILLFGGTRTDAVRGFRTNAAYAAAKTGLSSLAKSVAIGYASSGITCNVLCPGFVETEYLDSALKSELAAKNPDGKLISVREVADSALFLLKTPSINGVSLPIDKGWSPFVI